MKHHRHRTGEAHHHRHRACKHSRDGNIFKEGHAWHLYEKKTRILSLTAIAGFTMVNLGDRLDNWQRLTSG
jgi:hypothetical protein